MLSLGFLDGRHFGESERRPVCAMHGDVCIDRSAFWEAERARLLTLATSPPFNIAGDVPTPGLRIAALEPPTEGHSLDGAVILFPMFPTSTFEQPFTVWYWGAATERWRSDPIAADHIAPISQIDRFGKASAGPDLDVLAVRFTFTGDEIMQGALPAWAKRYASPDQIQTAASRARRVATMLLAIQRALPQGLVLQPVSDQLWGPIVEFRVVHPSQDGAIHVLYPDKYETEPDEHRGFSRGDRLTADALDRLIGDHVSQHRTEG